MTIKIKKSMKRSSCCRITSAKVLNKFASFLSVALPISAIIVLMWTLLLCLAPCIELSGRLSFLTNPKFQLRCLAAILSLWVIAFNLKKYIDVQTVQLLGDLRKMLNKDNKKLIHYYLLDKDEKDPIIPELETSSQTRESKEVEVTSIEDRMHHSNVELYDYLGTIELGVIMLDLGVINLDQFRNQFGYRVDNLFSNADVLKHITVNKEYYKYLWKAYCIMNCKAK